MSNITKTAMITVCGRPNVGKSSLTNALVGEKVAIVSNKAQTTRNRIYGIVNRGDTQFILLDTPGLHKPKSALGDYMVKVVTSSLADVDCALLLVEPIPHVGTPEKALIERVKEEKIPCILCINKIDTVEPAEQRSGRSDAGIAEIRAGRPSAVPGRRDHRPAGTAGHG